jgi:phosphoglycolate phosphatase
MFFIFDWDGTLCNSTPKIVRCMQVAAVKAGLRELSDAEVLNIIGLGLPEAIHTLYPDITEIQKQVLRESYSQFFVADEVNPAPLFDGVEETLNRLRDDGFHLAIATGKSRNGLERVLKSMGLNGFFHASRCADETASKPHPKMLFELLDELSYAPEAAFMIGDTEYDMDMAKRAAVPRIAVSYGAHHIDRLKRFEPALCVDRFPQILSILS